MGHMQRGSKAALWLSAALIIMSVLRAGLAEAQTGLNSQMQRVVARFVEQTGYSVLGVGSWIRGQGFNPATSDFDMRLVIPEGSTPAEQLRRWQQAKQQLAQMIRQEFGAQADNILARTNLYAPNQLMRGVEDAADAMRRFQNLNTVPNLAHTGPVTPQTTMRYAEGLYGRGAETYIQQYEQAAGRLFYNNNGRCVTGLSELAHLGEGAARFTAAGTANTAGQWAEHLMQAVQQGDGRLAAKYLERLERDLIKSRSLLRLPLDEAYRGELQKLRDLLKQAPGRLASVSDDVARLALRGHAEAALLRGMEEAGPVRRAFLRVMLDGLQARSELGKLLTRVMEKIPSAIDAENTVNFIVFALGTKATAQSIGRGDNFFESLQNVSGEINPLKIVGPLKLIGPALLLEITAAIINEARAGGYELAASFQEAWDLMGGIYTSWGGADVDPDPRRQLSLEDLVARIHTEERLQAIVYAQCLRAATTNLGGAEEKTDQSRAEAIFARCYPVIRDAWRWQRDCLMTEYLRLGSEIVHTPLIIYYKPTEPKPGERIICEARSYDGKLGERLRRMNEIIRVLYGPGSFVGDFYYWDPAGERVEDRMWQRSFVFDKPGKYPVKVRLEIVPQTRMAPAQTEPRVVMRRQIDAVVEIDIGGAQDTSVILTGSDIRLNDEIKETQELVIDFRESGAAWTDLMKRFAVTITKRGSLFLRAPGAKRDDLIFNPKLSKTFYSFYAIPAGVSGRVELQYGTSVNPDKGNIALGDTANTTCAWAFAPSKIVYRVRHSLNGQDNEKEQPGPVFQLDFKLRPQEAYEINIEAHLPFRKAFSTGKQNEEILRLPVGTIVLNCEK